jgi:hypothetical protein
MAGEDQKLERDKAIKLLIARWIKSQPARKKALNDLKKDPDIKITNKTPPPKSRPDIG